MIAHMTYQESIAVIKELLAAKTKEELQDRLGVHMSRVDGAFFSVVNDVAQQLRAQGKPAAAQHLTNIGDALARLRFMI
jgi:hypothetical protein